MKTTTSSSQSTMPIVTNAAEVAAAYTDSFGSIAKGGVPVPFPWRLHEMLQAVEEEGLEHIISWQPHGRAFKVHKPDLFVDMGVLQRFFTQSKYPSFQRQLNLYGFSRFAHGPDKGAYYHMCLVRNQRSLVRGMIRRKIKGNKSCRKTVKPHEEPNFYDPLWNQPLPEDLTVQDVIQRRPGTPVPVSKDVAVVAPEPATVSPTPSTNVLTFAKEQEQSFHGTDDLLAVDFLAPCPVNTQNPDLLDLEPQPFASNLLLTDEDLFELACGLVTFDVLDTDEGQDSNVGTTVAGGPPPPIPPLQHVVPQAPEIFSV